MKKWILIIVGVVLLVGGAYLYTSFRSLQTTLASAAQLETAELKIGTITATIGATGQVRSAQSAIINWRTSGTVEQVDVKEGQAVKAGQVLARLAQTSLPQNVILAEADLATYQQALEDLASNAENSRVKAMQEIAQYEQAVKDAQYQLDNFIVPTKQADLSAVEAVDQMKARLEAARVAFEPYKHRAQDNGTRQDLKADLDAAQSDYNAAVRRLDYEYELEVAQANLERAWQNYKRYQDGPTQVDVKAAEAKVAATQATLSQAWIEAPFAGVLTQVEPQPGDQVSAGTAAFRIDNLDAMYVDLQVSEIDIRQIAVGQEVTVTFDALRDQVYHGQVSQVALVSSQAAKTVDFTVTVQLTDADANVHPGMTAEVEIVVAQRENVLLIPNQAVHVEDGKQVVYVLREDSVSQSETGVGTDIPPFMVREAVEVTLGISSETNTELLAGDLQAGDQIVLNPGQEIAMPTGFAAMFAGRREEGAGAGSGMGPRRMLQGGQSGGSSAGQSGETQP